MTEFQSRVFTAVVSVTRKKGSCSVMDLRRSYFRYYSSAIIEGSLKVLVKSGVVKNVGGRYSAVAEVRGVTATLEDLE
ncbi:TPA: hypothetical protein P1L80_004318 [Escherichia coli]|nr:MAG: hypothetical protein [Bacteriophage sp.]HCY2339613.1 hypothetical protein [Escherichia coli]HDN3064066.1 hypothetical protein [Escherichia coli]